MSEAQEKQKHGGNRAGAGRKSKYKAGDTKVTRIPKKYLEPVKLLVAFLDETSCLSVSDDKEVSEVLRFVSANEVSQTIEFTVKATK